jgi:hypothetical protein
MTNRFAPHRPAKRGDRIAPAGWSHSSDVPHSNCAIRSDDPLNFRSEAADIDRELVVAINSLISIKRDVAKLRLMTSTE